MNASHPVNSTRRDAVLLFASRVDSGLLLTVKSLRSTGARCRIVLLVPDTMSLRPLREMIDLYDIEVFLWYEAELRNRTLVPHMFRYEVEARWLADNEGSIDRVFHTDTFDAYFQGDVFAILPHDRLLFAVEPHVFGQCGWNGAWIGWCYRAKPRPYQHTFIICSGSIGGNASHYLRLLRLMMGAKHWRICWERSMDQPILNVLVWDGHVERAGIPYSLAGCESGLFTVTWCALDQAVSFNAHGQIISRDGSVPAYVHQYNRLPALSHRLNAYCFV